MSAEIRIARAGAGSGKTHWLCDQLAGRIVAGLDPARVIATTFTRKAAAELKGRIQARLLRAGSLDLAERVRRSERLELAAIGTVHSVGHQLLRRYAIHLGLSPNLEVLDEGSSRHTLRFVLDRGDPDAWSRLRKVARRLSQDNPEELAIRFLDAARGNRIDEDDFRQQMQDGCRRLLEVMAPDGCAESGLSFTDLRRLAEEASARIAEITDNTDKTRKALSALYLLAASGSTSWASFVRASKIEAGRRSGADDCLEDLRNACGDVLRHPDVHSDICDFVEGLAETTLHIGTDYKRYKAERGLVDFTDLEIMILDLLEDSDLSAEVAGDFDLVAVDEFQDTNPLQLAIFQRLRDLVGTSIWVGDSKQAIFGFRGADPQLVESVWTEVPQDCTEALGRNYRSVPGLVNLVGELFSPLYGEEARLEPRRTDSEEAYCTERWVLLARNNGQEVGALAAGLRRLQEEGTRLRDVAVLVRRNSRAMELAEACRRLRVPVLLALPGLLRTREGALLKAGLQLAADSRDSLAAATILHILGDPGEETPLWFRERLDACRSEDPEERAAIPWEGSAPLAAVRGIDERDLPVAAALELVIAELDIGNCVREWGNVAERAANLDALREMTVQYEAEMHRLGRAATLTGLVSWLENLAAENKDLTNPPFGVDAITILTYHKSKGLEWPVVVLSDLGFDRDTDVFRPRVTGISEDPSRPLATRAIRFWPYPFGRNQYGVPGEQELSRLATGTPEAQEQAQAEAEESVRLLYVGFTRARDRLILAHREGRSTWLDRLERASEILPSGEEEGTHELAGLEATCLVRRLAPLGGEVEGPQAENTWLDRLAPPESRPDAMARFTAPSNEESVPAEFSASPVTISSEVIETPGDPEAEPVEIGNAVHAYLAALPSLGSCEASHRNSVAERCLSNHGADGSLSPAQLVAMGEALKAWVESEWPDATWHCEMPFMSPRRGGGHWAGTVDLLLVLPDERVVVIDHKACAISPGRAADRALSYSGQLAAYQEALEAQGLRQAGLWIHMPLTGTAVQLDRQLTTG